MLAWTIYISFAAAAGMLLLPARDRSTPRVAALAAALAALAAGLLGCAGRAGGEYATITDAAWIPSIGCRYHLAADGISMTLVVLTGLASVAGILFSWNVEKRPREFFALYLALIGGVYGVFLSADLLLLFVFYEIAIIPKYFLIAIWGSTRREYAAMKLALYSFVGSALVLGGLVAAFAAAGGGSFDLQDLAHHAFPKVFQGRVFPFVFLGFAILAGLWPFHTWAPTGHSAAPTAASMLLAGVVMKLGAYGCLRVAMVVFPEGFAEWRGLFAFLAAMGVVLGALAAMTQHDLKFVIGYSSVSHMGFVMLGLAAAGVIGLSGAVLQMFSHGVIAGLLFGVVGRMVYDREHTRELADLERRDLGKRLPFAAAVFVLAGFASMGMPGFSGFVAEFKVLVGAWSAFPRDAWIAGLGVVFGAVYILRTLQRTFLSTEPAPAAVDAHHGPAEPVTWAEKAGAALLLASTLVIGLFPRLLLDWIVPALQTPMFDGLRKGGLL
jgi:NADH-quinone oxidoreductase subunit M